MPPKAKLLFVFGTRPEAIKLAPLIREVRDHSATLVPRICVTAQHRELLDFVLRFFKIAPDYDLNLMKPDQSLFEVTTRALGGLETALKKERPDLVVVQGDTTSAMAAALAAFYSRIRVAHVEAGLRTHDLARPYPEELNRQVIDRIAGFLFAPTAQAAQNLRAEGLSRERVFTVGNTGIDALLYVLRNLKDRPSSPPVIARSAATKQSLLGPGRNVLLTLHRRESFGAPMLGILRAINHLVQSHPNLHLFFPIHPNPSVQKAVRATLPKSDRIHLLDPLSYPDFVRAMTASDLILTDSGGVQEEAPYLKRPFLVLREVTERPEGIALGFGKLVGLDPARIYRESAHILKNGYRIPRVKPPYGDGKASARIRKLLESHL